jgi:ActR/RegA family two-component response regulator
VKTRLLFVDDDESIRLTLPTILAREGFEVTIAGSVPEGLDLIQKQTFDVLLSDLNIGSPGDGFTLVSAMRRTQPAAATLILTGYPDFETALEAIRQQVDGYITKPADIPTLLAELRNNLRGPRQVRRLQTKPVSAVVREHIDRVVREWLAAVNANAELQTIPLRDEERVDHLPALLHHLSEALDYGYNETPSQFFIAAARYGELRARQGCTIPMILLEARILNKVLTNVLQENLLAIDLSSMIGDILKMGEHLSTLLEESIRAFERAHMKPKIA